MTNLTVGNVGGQSLGHAPQGPLSPSFEPIHNIFRAMWLNLKNDNWTVNMLAHRPIGHMPNLAPANLQYRGTRIRTGGVGKKATPSAPFFGQTWAGTGG